MRKILYLSLVPLLLFGCKEKQVTDASYVSPAPVFCEDSAYQYVVEQCAFGPRVMNSKAHDACGEYIAQTFRRLGAVVYDQYADAKLYDGTPVKMRNIIASYRPEATERILIAGHWDSRQWADNDPDERNHAVPIDGANDGASSIAVMLEIARQLQLQNDSNRVKVGVDLICWDAEDNGESSSANESSWCLGSQYWSGVRHIDGYTARYGINLDMVGGHNTIFYRERYSMAYAPSIIDKVWAAAQRIGYGKFFSYDEEGGYITDDHLQVNRGGIPCIDVIGFDRADGGFPATWHTVNDNIKNINKETLKAVGQTMLEVLWTEEN
ncbi:MAG: M28 family peptidase [Bacteroidaceae bacterium]|nr:M28 family peptidase [Bacteroidaceae bacterium]